MHPRPVVTPALLSATSLPLLLLPTCLDWLLGTMQHSSSLRNVGRTCGPGCIVPARLKEAQVVFLCSISGERPWGGASRMITSVILDRWSLSGLLQHNASSPGYQKGEGGRRRKKRKRKKRKGKGQSTCKVPGVQFTMETRCTSTHSFKVPPGSLRLDPWRLPEHLVDCGPFFFFSPFVPSLIPTWYFFYCKLRFIVL